MKLANCKLIFKQIGRTALCFLLICALCISFFQQAAHAEVLTLTVTILAGVVVTLMATYGLITYYPQGTSKNSIRDWIEALCWSSYRQHPNEWATAAFVFSAGAVILNESATWLCNNVMSIITHDIPVGVATPTEIVDINIGTLELHSSKQTGTYDTMAEALNAVTLNQYNNGIFNTGWSFIYTYSSTTSASVLCYFDGVLVRTLSRTSLPSGTFYTETPNYFEAVWNGSGLSIYSPYVNSSNKIAFISMGTLSQSIMPAGSYLSDVEGAIPEDYTPPAIPAVGYGVSATYEGASDTDVETWVDGAYTQTAEGTLVAEREEQVPFNPPVPPIPGEYTTWEDGALEFFSSIGGTIAETLGQAGTAVRNWYQNQVSSLKGVLDAILAWCNEFADTFVHAEDTWIGGIVDSFETVFSGAIARIRTALGLWHYVVDWVLAVTAPFNFFLDAAGRVSYHLLLPIYASLAGLVILGIYKRFIG